MKSIEVNTPGTNSSIVLDVLANAGATQCEPGNALHGTTPLHAIEDLPELPAVIYLSEISHLVESKAYCFGGGLYIDPVFPKYDLKAIISNEEDVGSLDTRGQISQLDLGATPNFKGSNEATIQEQELLINLGG